LDHAAQNGCMTPLFVAAFEATLLRAGSSHPAAW
jgi:hypothetical protein